MKKKKIKKTNRAEDVFSEDEFSVNEEEDSDEEENEDDESRMKIWSPEEMAERNERTVFVGNLPVKVIEKAEFRELKKTFGAFGSIESIRFRSIASRRKVVKCLKF